MLTTIRCRSSPISQNSGVVNTFPEISFEGYNAQNKEFVKRFFEKNFCLPQAHSILKISYDFSKIEAGGS